MGSNDIMTPVNSPLINKDFMHIPKVRFLRNLLFLTYDRINTHEPQLHETHPQSSSSPSKANERGATRQTDVHKR